MRRSSIVVGLVVVACLVVQAQSPHPIVGTWEMNAERSTSDPGTGEREQNSAISFIQSPDGLFVYTRSLITSVGNPGFAQMAFKLDDQDYPLYTIGTLGNFLATGTASTITGMVKAVGGNAMELMIKVAGQPAPIRRFFTVDSDGETLTYRITGINGEGEDINDVLVFDRVQ